MRPSGTRRPRLRGATLLLALGLGLGPNTASAQALRTLDSFEEGESPEAELRARELGVLRGDPAALARLVDAHFAVTGRAFVMQDFCEGCQRAHLWLINTSDEPVWSLEVPVTLRYSVTGESVEYTMFLPALPARSTARMSFLIPWAIRRRVWIRLGDPPPPDGHIWVDYEPEVAGRALDESLVHQLLRRRSNYSPLDGQLHGSHDSVDFVFERIGGAPLTSFAQLLAQTEGGAARLRRLALRGLGGENGPALVAALPEEEIRALLQSTLIRPSALGVLLARSDDALFERLFAQLTERPWNIRRAFFHAAMRTDNPTRFETLTSNVPAEERGRALRVGWGSVHDDDAMIATRLAWLRTLEQTDAERALTAQTIERRRLRGWQVPAAARADAQRVRRAAPEAVQAVYREPLLEIQPFDVDDLIAAEIDLRRFYEEGRLALHGCGDPRSADDLERCVDSIETHPELLAIAAEHGLRPAFFENALTRLEEEAPTRRAEVAQRLEPLGFDASLLVTGLCEDSRAVFEPDRPPFIDAARRLDPNAPCVREADAELLGMNPSTLAVFALILLFVFLIVGFGVWLLLRHQRQRREAMEKILASQD